MSTSVKVWMSVLLLALAAYGGYTMFRVWRVMEDSRSQTAAPVEPAKSFAEFTFLDQDGNPFPLKQLEGKPWVASFFFADCPGVCRTMNATIAQLHNTYADRDLTWVSISVDPANDTPQVLARYAKGYSADPSRWIFLTGAYGDAERLGHDIFQVSAAGRTHSERLILVDAEGKIRGRYLATDPLQLQALKRELDALPTKELQ